MENNDIKAVEDTEVEKTIVAPHSYALTILYAINRTGRHIYEGTVSKSVIAKRRKANKAARKQRKINKR